MLDRPASSQRARLDMYNANTLKLGLFGANCSSGRAPTKVPERWSASWEDCLALARQLSPYAHRRAESTPPVARVIESGQFELHSSAGGELLTDASGSAAEPE